MRNVPHPQWKWSRFTYAPSTSGTWVPTTALFIQVDFMECSDEGNISRAGTLVVSGSISPRRTRPQLMAKASIWMRRRRRRASQAIRPMVMHRKRRTRLLRRPVRPQRMIASLPIEATRARFQRRLSNWLLELGRLGMIAPVLAAQPFDLRWPRRPL